MVNDKLEASAVRDLMSRLNGAPYEVSKPPKDFRAKPEWFVWSPDASYAEKTGHAWAVWLDSSDKIRLESVDFGDTTDWVEASYGEKGAVKAMSFDYTVSAEEVVRTKIAKEFPLVGRRLSKCDKVIVDVASKSGVPLELLVEGVKGKAWFKVTATLAKKSSWALDEKSIELANGALKEAFERVSSIEFESLDRSNVEF